MAHEREIAEEQAFLDRALDALDHMRDEARSLRDSAAVATMRGAGDLVERDVVMGTALHRLDQLAIGDQPLFFGRIDYAAPDERGRADALPRRASRGLRRRAQPPRRRLARAGRRGLLPRDRRRDRSGLARRRHVAIRGREVTGRRGRVLRRRRRRAALPDDEVRDATDDGLVEGGLALGGPGALLAALGRARTGRMGDIVATIQGEQDRIIRTPAGGRPARPGRPGHRQDRGRAAPRGVPALHAPRDPRASGRARRRARTRSS